MVATERFLAKLKNEGRQEALQEERERTVLSIYRKKGWSAIEIADFLEDYSIEFVQSIIDKFEKDGGQEN